MMPENIKAEYSPGRKPVFKDLGADSTGLVRLSNDTDIAVHRVADLRDRVYEVIPHVSSEDTLKTESFYLADEWDAMSNSYRRLLGMALAHLVEIGSVPLECTNIHKSGTRKYRLKK